MDEEATARAALVHRQLLQLSLLLSVAVATFFVTKAVADSNRATALRDAAEWHRRGQEAAAAGNAGQAIDALRRAVVRDRGNRQYALDLARARALAGDDEGARRALLAQRESSPEDPQINLDLARIAAARGDVDEALRFYRHALYAPWASDLADARRGVRIELVRYLLTQNQTDRGLAELVALSADASEKAADRIQLGRLFAQAGDPARALAQFEQALRADEDDGDALAGAGEAAFALGQYRAARDYLRRVPDPPAPIAELRDVADLVLSRDPLAPRLGSLERRRRLLANLAAARQRLDVCVSSRVTGEASAGARDLQAAAAAFAAQLDKARALEQDTLEAGVEMIGRVEGYAVDSCGPPTALDRALLLVSGPRGARAQ
jgi:tetratricopeptide (TPR) repeat protein